MLPSRRANENSPIRNAKIGWTCEAYERAPFPRIRVRGGILGAGTSASGRPACRVNKRRA